MLSPKTRAVANGFARAVSTKTICTIQRSHRLSCALSRLRGNCVVDQLEAELDPPQSWLLPVRLELRPTLAEARGLTGKFQSTINRKIDDLARNFVEPENGSCCLSASEAFRWLWDRRNAGTCLEKRCRCDKAHSCQTQSLAQNAKQPLKLRRCDAAQCVVANASQWRLPNRSGAQASKMAGAILPGYRMRRGDLPFLTHGSLLPVHRIPDPSCAVHTPGQ